MLEELKSKTIEEQIEIISNKESLKQLMKSVDVRTFQEYIEGLKNINGEELINNVIEIINNNDDLILYIALLWRDQIKKIEPTQIKKILNEISDKNKMKTIFYNLDEDLISDLMSLIEDATKYLNIQNELDEDIIMQNVIENIKEDNNFLQLIIEKYNGTFNDIYEYIKDNLDKEKISEIIESQKNNAINIRIIDKFDKKQISEHFEEIKELILDGKYYISHNSSDDLKNNVELVKLSLKRYPNLLNEISDSIIEQIPKEEIENAIKNGFKIYNTTSNIIKNNPEYIALAIDYVEPNTYYDINRLVSNSTEQGLTIDNFKKALNRGFEYSENIKMPDFITNNEEYLKTLLENANEDSYKISDLYTYINNNLPKEKFTSNIFKILLTKEKYLNYFLESIPKFIFENPENIKELLSTNIYFFRYIPNESITDDILNSGIGNIIEEQIKEKNMNIYEIENFISKDAIKNNPYYISIILDNFYEYHYINLIVNKLNEQGLTIENFKKSLDIGYRFNKEYTPDFILIKPNYLKELLEKTQKNQYDEIFEKLIKTISKENLTSDLLKMILDTNYYIDLPEFIYENPENIQIILEKDYRRCKSIPEKYMTQQLANEIVQKDYQKNKEAMKKYKRDLSYGIISNIYIAIALLQYGNFYALKDCEKNILDSEAFTNEMKKIFPNLDYTQPTHEIVKEIYSGKHDLTNNPLNKELIRTLVKSNYVISQEMAINIMQNEEYFDEYLETTELLGRQYRIIDSIPQEYINEKTVKKLIDHGYEIDFSSPKIMMQYEYIKYAIEKGQIKAVDCINIEKLKENEKQELEKLIKKAIDNGYQINKYSSEIIKQYKYIKYAIKKGQGNALNYIDIDFLTDEEKQELEKLIYTAIDNGYQIANYSQEIIKQYKYIKYAVEKGQGKALNCLNMRLLTEEEIQDLEKLIKQAIETGYIIDLNSPKKVTQYKYIKYAIERNQPNALLYLNEEEIVLENLEKIEELMYDAIKNNLSLKNVILFLTKINLIKPNYQLNEKTSQLLAEKMKQEKCLELLLYMDEKYLTEELIQIKQNANILLEKFGKINTIEKNPVISFEFIEYVYPLLGIDLCTDLLKYNSGAAEQIIGLIKGRKEELLIKYYNNICPKIFEYDDKTIHYAFRYFNRIHILIQDIISKNVELNQEDLNNLKNIILNYNRFNIRTIEELKQYKTIIKIKIDEIANSKDEFIQKNFIASLFGYDSIEKLKNDFNNYQLSNFHKINFIIGEIKKSEKIQDEIIKKYKLTNEEIKIILLLKEIIETSNVEELSELIKNSTNNNELVDYSKDVKRIIEKIRGLYNLEFQTKLTSVESLKSKRTQKSKTIKLYKDKDDKIGYEQEVNYEIIDMDSEKFNFLAHRIYHYDPKMKEFCEMLMKNPTLWDKLDGASTLSTSSISDKGFHMLHATDNSGVIYLFNELTDDFMLFMYGRDLYVEHGGHKLEPTSNRNHFTDFNGLNQASTLKKCGYNEVAGFREGMMPCAIACVGEEPNEEQIRAAAYFNIPIIRFNIKAYTEQNIEKYIEAKEDLKKHITKENLDGIFLSGKIGEAEESLETKYEYCFNILKEKYKSQELTEEEYLKNVLYIESLLDRICDTRNSKRTMIRKTELFLETFCSIKKITEDELIDIETANMGESGLMFKYEEKGKEYLLKPAVEKEELKQQNFRAEIQKSASILQRIISKDTAVEVDVIGTKTKISKQEKIELGDQQTALNDWIYKDTTISKKQTNQLLQEYVVDFLLCNFDCFEGNFIIDSNNNIRGIDKEQSFRFIDDIETLNPDFSYVPNGEHRIPIYKFMFEKYQNGEIELDFTTFDKTIERVKLISDEEYKNIFRPYAESLNPYNPEMILEKILERKHKCTAIMEEYIKTIRNIHQNEEDTHERKR